MSQLESAEVSCKQACHYGMQMETIREKREKNKIGELTEFVKPVSTTFCSGRYSDGDRDGAKKNILCRLPVLSAPLYRHKKVATCNSCMLHSHLPHFGGETQAFAAILAGAHDQPRHGAIM
jgi:hypothetical protein